MKITYGDEFVMVDRQSGRIVSPPHEITPAFSVITLFNPQTFSNAADTMHLGNVGYWYAGYVGPVTPR